MVCECHGEPMTWQRDVRHRAGGWWVCREKRREYNQRRSAQRVAWSKTHRSTVQGRVKERLWRLGTERRRIVKKLDQLRKEGERFGLES